MAELLRICDWDRRFENNRTRELKKLMWVPMPNRHDGDGYTELLDHPNGPSHYAAWAVMVQVASRCDPRGTLVRGTGEPHDSTSLARMTSVPAKVFEEAIPRLLKAVWLERISSDGKVLTTISQEGAALGSQEGAASRARARMEEKGMEGKGKEEQTPPSGGGAPAKSPYSKAFEEWWKAYPRKAGGKGKAFTDWKAALKKGAITQTGLLEITRIFARSPKGQSGKFCPHASTWLNQGRYDDDPKEWQKERDGNSSGNPEGNKREELKYFPGCEPK